MLIRALAYQSHSKRRRRPGRLAFQKNGGAVRCRAPHVAVPLSFQNPLPSRRRPLQITNGVPDGINRLIGTHSINSVKSPETLKLIKCPVHRKDRKKSAVVYLANMLT